MQPDVAKAVSEYNFSTALVDFQRLKQQNLLPQKMAIKLQYLQNKILNRPIVLQEYRDLPQYQLQSLQQCDKPSQTTLFVSIVKCLSGREVIVYFTATKAYIKKEETFSIWNKCYLSCDSSHLYVKKKATKKTNYYQFRIRLLKVSKKYLEYKGRHCFGIMYDDKKYMLGFEQETACERIFKTLKQLVKENQPEKTQKKLPNIAKSQQILYEKTQKNDKSQLLSSSQNYASQNANKQPANNNTRLKDVSNQLPLKSSDRMSSKSNSVLEFEQDQTHKEIDLKEVKQAQISEAIRQEIRRQNISSDLNFKLLKNFQSGRLLVYNGPNEDQMKQAKTKTSMILSLKQSKVDYPWLLEQYLSMKSWNLEIEQSKIIHKVSENSYKLYLQFKKYSMLSLTRWVVIIATGIVIDKKVYLLVKSCEELTEEEIILGNYMSTVRMKKFDQTVEICQRSEKDDKVLLTIVTTADFGGYCSKADNLNMSLHILNNVQNFHNFLLSQAIVKDDENGKIPLFELNPVFPQSELQTPTKSESRFTESNMSRSEISSIPKRKQSYNSSEMSEEDVDNVFEEEEKMIHFEKKSRFIKSEDSIAEINSSHTSKQLQQMVYKEFMREFETFQITDRGTQKLVSFIESKIYQKYYLKQKFTQSHTYDPNAEKYNDDPASDNWLLQKGKWKISGIELVFTNEQILAQQKNVIKLILKQLSSNVMAGKNIMNMSLPVQIFQNKSFLQKLGEVYGFFPHYFNLAAKEKNIAKQITYVTQAIAFATTICPNIEKPFNPIIGETYQCKIGGVSLCFEQISHHPPISAFYLKTDEYECYGNHNPLVEIGLNTAVARNINPIFVRFFQTNTKYTGYGQDFEVGGLMFGQRTYKNSGRVNVFEEKNEILCQLSYGKNKKNIYESSKKLKTGQIIGGVFRVSNSFTKRFRQAQWKHFEGIKYDEKIEELAKITGNWMGDFYLDNVKMKGMYDVPPCKPVKETVVLASDCSFRLDVFYKKMNDNKKSQEWKEVMENLQRKDRKLREENEKDHPKKH